MLVFVALVLVGFFYVYKKGVLDWSGELRQDLRQEEQEMSHPAILETIEAFGETTHIADPSRIVALCRYLKDEEKYVRLSGLTAVDWHPSEPRFEVVYHLHSIERNERSRIKCRLSGDESRDRFRVTACGARPTGMSAKCSICSASRSAIIRTWCAF